MCSRAADVSELRAVGVEQQALDGAVAGRPFEWLVAHVVLQSTSTICGAGLKIKFATFFGSKTKYIFGGAFNRRTTPNVLAGMAQAARGGVRTGAPTCNHIGSQVGSH